MKAAIVLSMVHASIARQAGEINAVLNTIEPGPAHMEIWLFYRGTPPEVFPDINGSVSAVRLIALAGHPLPESYLHLLEQLTDQNPMDLLIFAGDGLGKELASRMAFRLNGSSCLQVEDCRPVSGTIEVIKPVYGNNLSATFVLHRPPFCLSLAKQPCRPAELIPFARHKKEILTLDQLQCQWSDHISTTPDQSDPGLGNAEVVLVVGQGAENKKTVDRLKDSAVKIGAAFGATRPVVMNAWTDMERLIGASGLILSPKLCIAAGVSGSAVFSAGIKASEFIVAINTDKTAPVFQIAHVGIIGEMKPVLLELEKIILAERAKKQPAGNKGPGIEG